MTDAFTAIFGEYTPVILADGQVVTNWGFICQVALFALVLFCVLRMFGAALFGGRR